MTPDGHDLFQQTIDRMLVERCSSEEEQSVYAHLEDCAACRQYLEASNSVVSGLRAFSFEVDPSSPARVNAALRLRAHQLERPFLSRRPLLAISLVALVLTVIGSLLELRLGALLASVFEIRSMDVRHSLINFWIVPSICLLLLFPILPMLSQTAGDGAERNL